MREVPLAGGLTSDLEALASHPKIASALRFLEEDNSVTVKQQMAITAIPAPTFNEAKRGEYYLDQLRRLGLEQVTKDAVGNIYGIRPGTGGGPTLAIFAHLDTVFPLEINVVPKTREGRIYGPGIADDSRGLATILTILRALNSENLTTTGDIIFGATVCEEGLGDLKGVKTYFAKRPDVDGFIALEPGLAGLVTYQCTGSRRLKVTYKGPGGHSFNDFGKPSAIHAMGRAIAKIGDLKVPSNPKTTFTVGVVKGGSSVNSLSADAEMLIDLRSTSAHSLSLLEKEVVEIVELSAKTENECWSTNTMAVSVERVGDRPAGDQAVDEPIVQTAAAAAKILKLTPFTQGPKGTDANVPLNLDVPAITLGCGGDFGGVHSLAEWFDPTEAYRGPQHILLTIVGLVGKPGVSQALLKERKKRG
ncbi:MAG: M20/M25/M40 family metallo-hydrolase [Limnochordia bacterium]|nr:M20/M25/M40 family metallo-hydrolase [Limnochordia bacterium]